MAKLNKGFNQLGNKAAAVLVDEVPGLSFDTLAAHGNIPGLVCVSLSKSANDNRQGETIYLDKAEAVAFAAHLTALANAL